MHWHLVELLLLQAGQTAYYLAAKAGAVEALKVTSHAYTHVTLALHVHLASALAINPYRCSI